MAFFRRYKLVPKQNADLKEIKLIDEYKIIKAYLLNLAIVELQQKIFQLEEKNFDKIKIQAEGFKSKKNLDKPQ